MCKRGPYSPWSCVCGRSLVIIRLGADKQSREADSLVIRWNPTALAHSTSRGPSPYHQLSRFALALSQELLYCFPMIFFSPDYLVLMVGIKKYKDNEHRSHVCRLVGNSENALRLQGSKWGGRGVCLCPKRESFVVILAELEKTTKSAPKPNA